MNFSKNTSSQKLIFRHFEGKYTRLQDVLAVEAPLEIRVAPRGQMAQTLTITMRTPGTDEELAVGFMFAEGILKKKDQVVQSLQVEDKSILLMLTEDIELDKNTLDRNFLTNSSCGVCGKNSLEFMDVKSNFLPSESKVSVPAKIFSDLPSKLFSAQSLFAETGGNHAAAIFDTLGNLLVVREDVGRHNALDKVLGWAFSSNKIPLLNHILLVSGRASFELIQKASMAGIGCMAAVGAPSSLAVDLAEKTGMTLVGFVKKAGFNIYTHAERIT